MIPRYTRPEMAKIFEAENRFKIWLEIETLACEKMAELGIIPASVPKSLRDKAKFDVARIDEIVEAQRTIGELERELNTATTQLGALMNVPPGTSLRLTGNGSGIGDLPGGSMSEVMQFAVANRPELREVAYRKRINEQEAHAALLELLPGLNLYAAANFDSNSFLLHNHWQSWLPAARSVALSA